MSWPEVETAKTENRHELVLSGPQISERIQKGGLDLTIFSVVSLNYLNIHDAKLEQIPKEIVKLINLQTLVLHSNNLQHVDPCIGKLEKLKVLDLSRNQIETVPQEIANLNHLTTLNLSSNVLVDFPGKFSGKSKLQVLDLANNKLKEFPEIFDIPGLTDLKLNSNEIQEIPAEIKQMTVLKNFDISKNKIKVVPGEIIDCTKIKEINLKENPIADRRLFKLIDQCRTKQVLDYVKQNVKKNPGKKSASKKEPEIAEPPVDTRLKLTLVMFSVHETTRIVVTEKVKKVRGNLLACLLHDIAFTPEKFKKFIQLQTKLHDEICEKRNAATIATHDHKKIASSTLTYTALPPNELKIQPLSRNTVLTGEELFVRLQTEAENLRKEKKRNVYTGIHKYLYLLEGQKLYPCLTDESGTVISFPPITNSELTKISLETTSILIEVTSPTSLQICKNVLDCFIRETVLLFGTDMQVEQVKNIDAEGNMKAIYPSKTDLVFNTYTNINVIRP